MIQTTNMIAHHWIIFNKAFVEAQAHMKLWTRSKDPLGEFELYKIRRDRINRVIERWMNETRS